MDNYVPTVDDSLTVEEGFNVFLCFENFGGLDGAEYMTDVIMV